MARPGDERDWSGHFPSLIGPNARARARQNRDHYSVREADVTALLPEIPVLPRRLRRVVALALAAALPAIAAASPAPDSGLRRTEQLDTSRLGRIGEDERALLRVEWRAARSAQAEAEQVQGMLDALRRMEGTVAEIGRLLRALPARSAPPPPEPAPPEDASSWSSGAWLAAGALLVLAALWFGHRRGSSPAASVAASEPVAEATPVSDPAPLDTPAPPAPAEMPATSAPPAMPEASVALPESTAAPAAPIDAGTAMSPPAQSAAESTPPVSVPDDRSTAQADHEPLEFTLEEADPDAVARAEARERERPTSSALGPAPAAAETHSEPTLELAEIMLSMGLEQSAAQALVEYSEAHPRQAVYHWLKLLDIYRGSGHRKDFKEAAEKLRLHFNIQADDWTRAHGGEAPSLEGFGRIIGHIQGLWQQPAECVAYLRHLIEDNREGTRAGFPQPVAEEILLLIEIQGEPAESQQAAAAGTTT